jgi:diacylglycerol kinase (ATP)
VLVGVVKNPQSGRGANNRRWAEITARLSQAMPQAQFLVEETTAPGSAKEQAAALAAKGCEVVVAAGGDGTVRDVMEGLLGSRAALAILPLGTGNDFAREIGVGPHLDLAVAALAANVRLRIDLGRWTQGLTTGHFINVAGCGFDAVVADRVNKGYRLLRGRAAYLARIFQSLIT